MKSRELMCALARELKWWQNTVVPNVYLGDRRDEMDLAVVSRSGLLWEVEIKISMADWKADLAKRKWARAKYQTGSNPARFYYAVPETLIPLEEGKRERERKLPEWLPETAGVLMIREDGIYGPRVRLIKQGKPMHRNKLPHDLHMELLQKLGARYWGHVANVDDKLSVVAV